MRHFLVDFFFGPCLDISAVNPRQDQESPNHRRHRSHNRNSNHQERKQQSKPRNRNSERSLHDNNGSTTKTNRRKSKGNSALSLDLVRLHTPTRNSPRGKSETTTLRRRKEGGGILSNNNGGAASKYKHLSSRSDDASVMTASLVETYRAYSTEITDSEISNTTSEEYLEEQSVIRRSLKDHAGNHRGETKKKKEKEKEVAPRLKSIAEYNEHDENAAITSAQQTQQFSASTNKSELANWIEKTTTPQCTASTDIEYDNVTTISQASKDPYTVLGVSQHSSSRVIDSSYQAKIKDAKVQQQQQHQIQQQQRGGHYLGDEGENKYSISEKAIADVTNAYRRIKADIQRQEQEEILRQEKQNRRSSQRKNTNSNDRSRQRQRSTNFTDSNERRVNSNSSSSSQKNTHHIKYNNNHTDDIDDDEGEVEEEDDNSSSSAKTRISKRLKDHRELVHDLFAKHNNKRSSKNNVTGTNSSSDGKTTNAITTLQQSITNQTMAMAEMKLVPIEAGANNINEQKQTIQNNCFYLSLAASYLSGVGAFDNVLESTITTTATTSVRDNTTTTANNHITTDNGVDHGSSSDSTIAVLDKRQKVITMNLALQLKRAIESAVLLVHPDWAKSGMVGEEVQAFSDFLVYALDSNSVLGHWAIAVFDEASGFVDVYRGRHYGKIYPPTKKRILSSNNNNNSSSSSNNAARVRWSYKDCNETIKRGNTLTLRYIPGHYQPLLPEMVTNKVKFDKQALSSSIEMNNTASHIGDHLRSNRPTLEDILSTLDKWNVLHCVTDGRA